MHLVVVNRAQRFHLTLQLAALLDILLLADETMIPPQVDAFDDLPDFLHPLQGSFVLYAIAHGGFNPLPEVGGNLQIGQHVDDQLVDQFLPNSVLWAGPVAAILAQTAIITIPPAVVPVGSHLAVVLIHQP
ncbi:MAG TPA: hypothetical protein VKY59_20230 [Spirillospora sp.]|nr:hypothetical protein [Spirillospora sp.]